ncbi:hypothetical protein EDC04DRAFT_683328 [Pisolithus marmoratus]|nr:hypothetical protein EDC04DRAFT_683328 [Pisolithus marmoratus]
MQGIIDLTRLSDVTMDHISRLVKRCLGPKFLEECGDLHSCHQQVGYGKRDHDNFPQPNPVVTKLDQELEGASVLWRASSKFCDKPDQPVPHSETAGIFSPWHFIGRNTSFKLDEIAVTSPLNIQRADTRCRVQELADGQLEILSLRWGKDLRCAITSSRISGFCHLRFNEIMPQCYAEHAASRGAMCSSRQKFWWEGSGGKVV